MKYTQLMIKKTQQVGIITINNPPRNAFSERMIREMLDILDKFERNDDIRAVMLNSSGPHFSQGVDAFDIKKAVSAVKECHEHFADIGGKLVERIDEYPKPTLVAARGNCIGGSSAIFNAFDIRIVGENFNIKDSDIYYGSIGSWGMSSLRLPIWIGRNKAMDYVFLGEGFNGRQAYELGIASRVVPDDIVDEIGLHIASKMSKAAPVAVRYFKECVRNSIYHNLESARAFEKEAASIVFATEDSQNGVIAYVNGEEIQFQGK